jgi:hypothetical protein
MNKAAKKSVKKRSTVASAVKPVKKRSKSLSAAVLKPAKKSIKKVFAAVADDDGWRPEIVPLAEVEVLAVKAVKMIKANRSVSPEKKARRLASVAETLERARGWGGLSKSGAWGLKHPFGIMKVLDWEAVLR